MTPDFVTLMAASKVTRSHAHSALPDAPVIADFIARDRAGAAYFEPAQAAGGRDLARRAGCPHPRADCPGNRLLTRIQ